MLLGSIDIAWMTGVALFATIILVVIYESFALFGRESSISATRIVGQRLSLGDNNPVQLVIETSLNRSVTFKVIDELPFQLQNRSFNLVRFVKKGELLSVQYSIRPVVRGDFSFGDINVFVRGRFGLIERRFICEAKETVEVHPSVMEMRRAELAAFTYRRGMKGQHKIRRIGHTMEFEKIKNYVRGDDIRSINWKATARSTDVMVNQFQDERSQDVYAAIDLGRVMYSPFEGMTSLDYAVNASLAFSNVVLKKHDNAGLLTFGAQAGKRVPAKNRPDQLGRINSMLFNLSTEFEESNDEHLVMMTRRFVTRRSLIMLYTNIDAMVSLKRRLPYLLMLAKRHVLVVVIFNNTEIEDLARQETGELDLIVRSTVARDILFAKHDIIKELRHYGIHGVLAKPSELSLASIKAYLDLKARGVI